ncbi:MAG: hypothetical protein JWM12_4076 [Ilumatobacteraceae bacterium]|nr:hypothetical protein [Ilumatobacteraceae bacterium]
MVAEPVAEPVAERLDRAWWWARSDDGARWAFRTIVAASVVVLYVGGRRQWFIRDDWALLLTRRRILHDSGVAAWLFTPQDGHWLTIPAIVFRMIDGVFGLGSYWPFLLTAMVPHVATVLLVRVLCRRHGVSAWTTTLVCAVLLVFGSGWEDILFAVQISYNLSLLGFLAQLVLTAHDGPLDWRDGLGLVCGFVGLLSSGFGPFFIVGIAVFLVLRRRWLAAVVATVPLAIGYGWWWLAYASQEASTTVPSGKSQVAAFAVRGLTATFAGLLGITTLAGLALVATLAVTVWRRGGALQPAIVALGVTALLMFAGVGWERVGYGLETAEASRYVYMGAMLLAPAFALAIDRVGAIAPPALTAGRLVLACSAVLNGGSLLSYGSDWARRSGCDRNVLELLAGSPQQTAGLDQSYQPLLFSPDVRLVDLPRLVDDDAIVARPPATPEEQALVQQALDPNVRACPAPV